MFLRLFDAMFGHMSAGTCASCTAQTRTTSDNQCQEQKIVLLPLPAADTGLPSHSERNFLRPDVNDSSLLGHTISVSSCRLRANRGPTTPKTPQDGLEMTHDGFRRDYEWKPITATLLRGRRNGVSLLNPPPLACGKLGERAEPLCDLVPHTGEA